MDDSEQLDDATLVAWFSDLNRRHFDGALAGIPVRFSALEGRLLGIFYVRQGSRRIELNQRLRADPIEAKRTLLHEMVHACIHVRGGPSSHRRNSSHGADFEAEVKRLVEAGEDLESELEWADCASTDEAALTEAALVCIERQAGRSKINGKYDKCGLWIPAGDEWRDCCRFVSAGTKRFPHGLRKHCATVTHVSQLLGVDTQSLRRRVEELKAEQTRLTSGPIGSSEAATSPA